MWKYIFDKWNILLVGYYVFSAPVYKSVISLILVCGYQISTANRCKCFVA